MTAPAAHESILEALTYPDQLCGAVRADDNPHRHSAAQHVKERRVLLRIKGGHPEVGELEKGLEEHVVRQRLGAAGVALPVLLRRGRCRRASAGNR